MNIPAVAIIIPLHTLIQIESRLTSEVPKVGRMMREDQEFRAAAQFPKWPKPRATAIDPLHGQPLKTEQPAT